MLKKLQLHVTLRDDPTVTGMRIAEIEELPDICVAVAVGEDLFATLRRLVAGYFETLRQIGRLEEVLLPLLEDGAPVTSVPPELDLGFRVESELEPLRFAHA